MKVKGVDDLRRVLVREIIPLLQEYFYNDWSRIQMVLGDHRASEDLKIIRTESLGAFSLFGETEDDLPDLDRYKVSDERTISADSIRKIYQPDS